MDLGRETALGPGESRLIRGNERDVQTTPNVEGMGEARGLAAG